tara:strand:+ start:82 stop:405 length:324 start_codon:yes stop_codon:yes gene_type:complete
MGLTVEQLGRTNVTGNRLSVALKITPDDSWLAAGEELDLTTYVANIETVHIETDPGGYTWAYDRSAKKLLAYYADNDAGADGALIAVANAVDLSGITVYITVTGGRA